MPSPTNEINDRFLIRLSGEVFPAGDQCVDAAKLELVGAKLFLARHEYPQIAVVVGGGKLFRDRSETYGAIDRVHADYVGVLATVTNGIILHQWVHAQGLASAVFLAFPAWSL